MEKRILDGYFTGRGAENDLKLAFSDVSGDKVMFYAAFYEVFVPFPPIEKRGE